MKWSTIKIRVIVPVVVFGSFIFFSVIIMGYIYSQLSASLEVKARQRVEVTAEILTYMMEATRSDTASQHGRSVIQRIIENVASVDSIDAIYLVDPNLTVTIDGDRKLTGVKAPAEISSALREAFTSGKPSSEIVFKENEKKIINVAPIRGGVYDQVNRSGHFETLYIETNFRAEANYLDNFLRTMLLVLLLSGSAVGLLLHLILTRRVIKPLQQFHRSAQIIADGDIGHRAVVARDDEIGSVVTTFNRMLDIQVEGSELQKRLAKAKEEAELKSEELEKTNTALLNAQAVLVNSAKMASLGEMAGGISHEINTPLAVITMRTQQVMLLMSEKDQSSHEKALSLVEIIEATAYRISSIVQGMRAFSRSADKDPMQKVKVGDIIKDTMTLCTEKLKNHGVDVQIESVDAALIIPCRAPQICQVLLNLVMNACDAVAELKEKWVKISASQEGETIKISVMDSGVRISEEIGKKIFQPFFTTKAVGKGTGLGLSISKGIVEEHGGTIALNMEEAHTCFVVSFSSFRE